MTNTCIMKLNDYITIADVKKLSSDQWKQFRSYLRSHDYRVDDGYGHHSPSYNNKWCVILDDDGDLRWVEEPANQTQRITYEQIIDVIQPQSPCIMQICDYIRYSDVHKLSAEQWQKFREYLRGYGHRVSDGYGNQTATYHDHWCIELDSDGDLTWRNYSHDRARAIPFELIIQAIEPQPSEPPHVQARNQHINEIKQLIVLHEELITRLHNTNTIGLKTSIDHHQQQIKYLRKSLEEAKHRCSGRTTNIALKTIAQAMRCPKQNIPIRDHHDTVDSHRHLAGMIESMLAKLQLTGFVIDRSKLTLHYQGL